LGVALAGFLTPMLLAVNGFEGTLEVQNADARQTILLSLTIYPAIAHFLLIPIVSFYKLNKKRCDEIRVELDQKANA
jgi:Na+/melibiose symporter-like transporter